MKSFFVTTFSFFTVVLIFLACKKNNTVTPPDLSANYSRAYLMYKEGTSCGYILSINGVEYWPINLPKKYKKYNGMLIKDTILMQFNIENPADSLICHSSTTNQRHAYEKLEIKKILE